MQTDNWNVHKIFEKPIAKWFISLSLIFLLIFTLSLGLRSQYDLEHKYNNIDICIFSFNCHQTQKQMTEQAEIPETDDALLAEDDAPFNQNKVFIKPLGPAIIAGGISSGVIVGLVWLGMMTFPIELALVVGAAIGTGTYFALKAFY